MARNKDFFVNSTPKRDRSFFVKEETAKKTNDLWVESTAPNVLQKQNINATVKPLNISTFVKDVKDTAERNRLKVEEDIAKAGYKSSDFTEDQKKQLISGNYSINPTYNPDNKFSQKIIYTGDANIKATPSLGQSVANVAEKTGRTAMDLTAAAATGVARGYEGLADVAIGNVGNFASQVTSLGGLKPNNVSENIRKGTEKIVGYGLAGAMDKLAAEKRAEGAGSYNPNILGMGARDIVSEGTRMFSLAPLGMPGFIGSAAGNNIEQAINEGEKLPNAVMYGNITGTIEGATEKLFDTFNVIGGGKLDKFLPKKAIAKFVLGASGEGVEEMISQAVNPFTKMLTYEQNVENPFGSWENFINYCKDVGEAGLQGFAMGMFMQGAHDISSSDIRNQYKTEITNAVNKIKGVAEKSKQSIIDGMMAGASRFKIPSNSQIIEAQKQAQIQNNEQPNVTLPNQAKMAQNANMEQIRDNTKLITQTSKQTLQNAQNDNFHKGLEKFNSKKYTQKDDIVVLDETPQYLYNLGFDADKPVVLNMSKLETIMKEPKGTFNDKNQHGITMDLVEQLPKAIQNPLNVIRNSKYNDRVVVVTELTDQYGDIVIVPIEMNSGGYIENIKNNVNRINTVYGKENYDIPKNEGKNSYIEYNKDNIIYDIDKDITKNRDVNSNYRLQLPSRTINTSNNSINQNDSSVNTEYAQSNQNDTADKQYASSMPKNKLSTQTEQRSKLRNFYQTAQEGSMVDKGYIKDIRKNKEQFEYNPISNQETLNGARSKVNEDSSKAERDFLTFNGEGLNADDVAVAEVLIADAIAKGDKGKANYLTATLAEKLTQAGQAIQATKIFKRMTPEGMILYAQKEINKINRDLEKDNPKLYKKLKDEGALPKLDDSDIEKITEYMQEAQSYSDDYWNSRQKDRAIAKALSVVDNKIPSTLLDKVASVRRSGLLFNLKTLMRNLGSNISFGTLEAFKDIPATGIDKLTSLITGERTVSLPNRAYFTGVKKGAIEGIEDVRDNIKTAGKDSKYELPKKTFKRTDTYRDIAETFKSGEIKEGAKKTFRRALSDYEDASMYIVEGTDRPFWQGRFESELANQMKLKGLEYGVDTPTTEMLESAQKSADYATFKNKNKVSETFGKIKSVLNAGKPIGAADVFGLTFTNVPGSVATKAYDYSPAGVITSAKELYNAIRRNGKFDQRNFVDSLSRALVGTTGWALGAYLIGQGIIRGAADDDDDKANAEKQMGLQENSLNISALERLVNGEDTSLQKGDKFYSFDWLQPAASPFLVGSDIYKAQKEGENPAFAGAKSAVNQIADMSSLSQVSKLFKGYSGSDMFENAVKVIGEFPSSFIPTIWNNAGQFTDEYKRVSYDSTDAYFKTNVNKILAKIPGLRTTLEKQIDTFGNEQKQYRNGNDFWSTFINPGYNSTYDPTPLQEEILRVYNETGDKGVFPITAANSVTYKNEATKLNPKQRMTYQKASGEYVTQILAGVIESNAYKNFDDTQKATLLKEVIADSNTLGKAAVGLKTKTYDDYMKKINQLGNVPLADYYNSYVAQKGIESDKDAFGKTIENSKSVKVKAAIDNATSNLSVSQIKILYDIFNVSKTVQESKTTKSLNLLPTLKQQTLTLPKLKK